MTDIKFLITKIIPPEDYQHRNGFGNEHIIDSLSENEKHEVEQELIRLLKTSSDSLIAETLAYLKSKDSLPILKAKLNTAVNPIDRIYLAKSIFKINKDDLKMKDIAFEEFQKIKGEFNLIGVFHLVIHFQDERINSILKNFVDDRRYLVAYNARICLGMDTNELIEREQLKRFSKKPWWKFW